MIQIWSIMETIRMLGHEVTIRYDRDKDQYFINYHNGNPRLSFFETWTPNLMEGIKKLEVVVNENKCNE